MRRRHALVLVLAATAAGVVCAPASAATRRGELLQDRAPTGTSFADRVLTEPRASAGQAAYRAYDTGDGTAVRVAVSSRYADGAALAQSYATFLGSLEHGSELARLRVQVATPSEVTAYCGGVSGVLACYDAATETMYVPGEDSPAAVRSGVTTSYVVAHEYGHHVAANRDNAPFAALDYGPKYWASEERVCSRALAGRLAPGNESTAYGLNPGEAWAETYAQLKYPGVAWSFTPLLAPTGASLAAARRDVTAPWTAGRRRTFRGTLSAGARRRSFRFRLRLDGAASFRLRGPSSAQYDLRVVSDGDRVATTHRRGSADRLAYEAACRTSSVETVRVTVLRRSGRGPFRVAVRYAG